MTMPAILSPSPGPVKPSSWATLPPELVTEIPLYLPIVCRPAALISLALSCRSLCCMIIPDMLYRAVWLEGEDRALNTLSRFNAQLSTGAQFSRHIRHLAVVSELSERVRKGPTNVLQELRMLVSAGGLHNLVALTLDQKDGWFWYSQEEDTIQGIRELGRPFWEALAKNCPMITHVHLTGFGDYPEQSWGVECGAFDLKALKTLRVMGTTLAFSMDDFFRQGNLDFVSKPSIEVLELPLPRHIDLFVSSRFSNLRTLILDEDTEPDKVLISQFWKNHTKLERIEAGSDVDGDKWFSGMSSGWLPHLETLKCTFFPAKALLPYVHSQLINLGLIDTVNAQALYLLRVITPAGTMPQLRSLGVELRTSKHSRSVTFEGNRWYEDGQGHISEVSKRKAVRYFDANYVATLAKAAPNVEELELIGYSKDSFHDLICSLRRFHRLRTLIISGAAHIQIPPFFRSSVNWRQYVNIDRFELPGPYKPGPSSLEEAASDLGDGCRTLEQIRFGTHLGQFYHPKDVTAVIVRDGIGGPVSGVRLRKGWGRLIGREDEW